MEVKWNLHLLTPLTSISRQEYLQKYNLNQKACSYLSTLSLLTTVSLLFLLPRQLLAHCYYYDYTTNDSVLTSVEVVSVHPRWRVNPESKNAGRYQASNNDCKNPAQKRLGKHPMWAKNQLGAAFERCLVLSCLKRMQFGKLRVVAMQLSASSCLLTGRWGLGSPGQ